MYPRVHFMYTWKRLHCYNMQSFDGAWTSAFPISLPLPIYVLIRPISNASATNSTFPVAYGFDLICKVSWLLIALHSFCTPKLLHGRLPKKPFQFLPPIKSTLFSITHRPVHLGFEIPHTLWINLNCLASFSFAIEQF